MELTEEESRQAGYRLIDDIAGLLASIRNRPVTSGEGPGQIRSMLGTDLLPDKRTSAAGISRATGLLFDHSLFNGHPKFLGYITSSPTPVGILADLLAAAVNPNVGAHVLSPMATEIERQAVRWLAEFIGLPPGYDGIMVSSGNMANFTAFLAGWTAKAPGNIKKNGLAGSGRKLTVYCPKTTHTWIEKAAILFGHGTDVIRWIPTGPEHRCGG